MKKAGLPNDKLFIYYDDTDHSHKINKFGKIVLLPKVKILHDTGKTEKKPNIICTWRDFYLTRNHTYTLKQYDKLTYIAYICYKAYKILLQYMKLKNKDVLKLHFIALHDGMNGKIGVHHIYKPGYEIQK